MRNSLEEYNKKIQKIELILKDDTMLDKYINDIDKNEITIPKGINDRILSQIKKQEVNKKEAINSKSKYYNILKVAACTAFAILIWETNLSTGLTKKDDFRHKLNIDKFYENVDNTFKNINNFLMTPHSVSKGE
ncbi:MAG: hypothetical protein N2749_02585 [Clostridia bacterium]|nr:hypothetical protein [Clostridia bacterium]